MTDIPDSVLDKIRHIREMASPERGATPHEIEVATAKLHKLLLRYNLDLAEITSPAERGVTHEFFATEHPSEDWQKKLLSVLARHHFCRVVHDRNTSDFAVVGQPHNIRAMTETFFWLATNMVKVALEAREATAESKPPTFGWIGGDPTFLARNNPRRWLLSYLYGMVDGIDQQLTASQREAMAERNDEKGLVPLLREEVAAYLKEHFKTEQEVILGAGEESVSILGRRAGKNLDLAQRKAIA